MLRPFLHSGLDDAGLRAVDFRVYVHICRRAGGTSTCYSSIKRIAADTKLHPETVSAAIERLKAARLIKGFVGSLCPVDRALLIAPAELDEAGLTFQEMRVLYHVLRKEGCKKSQESACFSSLRKIAQATRISRATIPSIIESLIDKGFLHRGAVSGLWSRYADSKSTGAPSAPKTTEKVALPKLTATRPITADEHDEADAAHNASQPQPAYVIPWRLDTPKRSLEREKGLVMNYQLNSVYNVPLLPACSTAEIVAIAARGEEEFRGMSLEDARCATVLYGTRCLAESYPGIFPDTLSAKDWEGAKANVFDCTARQILVIYAGLRLQACVDLDKHVKEKTKIKDAFRFTGRALLRLSENEVAMQKCYERDAEDAALHLETPIPASVMARYKADVRDGCYKFLERKAA